MLPSSSVSILTATSRWDSVAPTYSSSLKDQTIATIGSIVYQPQGFSVFKEFIRLQTYLMPVSQSPQSFSVRPGKSYICQVNGYFWTFVLSQDEMISVVQAITSYGSSQKQPGRSCISQETTPAQTPTTQNSFNLQFQINIPSNSSANTLSLTLGGAIQYKNGDPVPYQFKLNWSALLTPI
jgi:hypothetical protein